MAFQNSYRVSVATGINDAGQIVGSYQDDVGSGHGFLATPTAVTTPIVTSVSAAPSDGDLGPGSTVILTVNFSEAVTVAGGTPSLALNDGGTAFYTSGSGSSALVFTYTVGALGSGQNTPDLALAATNAINLNGATITDAFGTAADLSGANGYNPAGTLLIDTTAPTVSSIAAVTDNGLKDLNAGHVVTITVGTSEVVNVTGTPTLQLNDSEVATYIRGTGTNTLTFTCTVQQGDITSDLQVTGLNLPNGATVQDGAGNDLSGPVAQDLALQIDTINPIVTAISATPSIADLGAGEKVAVTLTMSAPVKVKGTPTLVLNDGGTASYKAAASNPATGTLVFDYTVKTGQNTPSLVITSVNIPTGASVKDAAGHSADFANALTTFTGLQIDTTPPTVSTISALPSSGNLTLGDTAAITLGMSEPVNVTGTPTLKLNDGGTATYVSGTGTNSLVFDYLVAGSDKPTSDLRITGITNERAIQDLAGNALTGPVTNDLALVVEPPVNLTGSNLVIEMAELAKESYGNSTGPAIARNWAAVELNIPESGTVGGVSYTFSNGVYSVPIANGNAEALVLEGNVNGVKTLTIAFRGTDDWGTVENWPTPGFYFSQFLPLISTLGDYVVANGIKQVLATGHSLGGSMVQDFLATPIAGIRANIESGYTWASPGADLQPVNARLINFEHTNDPVVGLGGIVGLFIGGARSGTDIFIDSTTEFTSPLDPIAGHHMAGYLDDTLLLVERAGDQASVFYNTADAKALRNGDFWSHRLAKLEVMPGTDQNDNVVISPNDQFVLGGPGNDTFNWTPLFPGQQLTNASPTVIDGGAGVDTIAVPGLPIFWSWQTKGAETDLFQGKNLVAKLYDVENVYFELTNSKQSLEQSQSPASPAASLSLLVQNMASFASSDVVSIPSGNSLPNDQTSIEFLASNAIHH